MLRGLESHPYYWLIAAAAALVLVAVIVWWRRRPRDPQEIERRRREYLSRVGRIVEGEILEILESADISSGLTARKKRREPAPAPPARDTRSLVFYTYSISGVTYETAQDVTGFEERACLKQIMAGQPASVKYDPASPGNSMLIAETWSGLH
jgi:hypothetical protein